MNPLAFSELHPVTIMGLLSYVTLVFVVLIASVK